MTTTTDELQRTILGRLSGAPAGLAPRALLAGLPAPQAQVALGLLIVSGRVNEVERAPVAHPARAPRQLGGP